MPATKITINPNGSIRIEGDFEIVDNADIYGGYTCEGLFGTALAAEPGLRDRLEVVTKCGIQLVTPNRPGNRLHHYNTSRDHIIASAENSLSELHTDRLDLLLIHRPDALMEMCIRDRK